MWKALTIVILAAMLGLMWLVFDATIEVLGFDVPGWVVVFASYALGVLALYAQYRSEGRVTPKRTSN